MKMKFTKKSSDNSFVCMSDRTMFFCDGASCKWCDILF